MKKDMNYLQYFLLKFELFFIIHNQDLVVIFCCFYFSEIFQASICNFCFFCALLTIAYNSCLIFYVYSIESIL